MKAYERNKGRLKFYAFLASVRDGQFHVLAALIPGKVPRYRLNKGGCCSELLWTVYKREDRLLFRRIEPKSFGSSARHPISTEHVELSNSTAQWNAFSLCYSITHFQVSRPKCSSCLQEHRRDDGRRQCPHSIQSYRQYCMMHTQCGCTAYLFVHLDIQAVWHLVILQAKQYKSISASAVTKHMDYVERQTFHCVCRVKANKKKKRGYRDAHVQHRTARNYITALYLHATLLRMFV